jgi:hypothetical protein
MNAFPTSLFVGYTGLHEATRGRVLANSFKARSVWTSL